MRIATLGIYINVKFVMFWNSISEKIQIRRAYFSTFDLLGFRWFRYPTPKNGIDQFPMSNYKNENEN